MSSASPTCASHAATACYRAATTLPPRGSTRWGSAHTTPTTPSALAPGQEYASAVALMHLQPPFPVLCCHPALSLPAPMNRRYSFHPKPLRICACSHRAGNNHHLSCSAACRPTATRPADATPHDVL
ncbi:hypothetical protein K505DRAFT_333661 [Melanomma pulvis-pyrius CBS 109.77]|uniref:Uncharacterized protein n=1 Tax=Melanomma pulvis-pyrius CBS 109.77 TaxID=1314802 RepID=A0A6A6XP50_9PLEO|nr:hypothetical protein K505DRAFT_333661 [Melanomma pulvis-pyrius CBS 109.77]